MSPQAGSSTAEDGLQARDVVSFGQEVGRVLSDGRIVGRAEPFAKVFPSSRGVKRAVGVTAWAILEDIALDARLDVEGRLVAETNVRRIAANLSLSKNTVTKHLSKLREHGFVLHEEQRDDGTGRYETSRYVLDPSACLERFTRTPSRQEHAVTPHPKTRDTAPANDPRPNKWDTAATSQQTGHRGLGQKNKKVVVHEDQQPQAEADAPLVDRLISVGIAADRARDLVAEHPEQQVADALDAVEAADVRNPAGWIVAAIRDGWDLTNLVEIRRDAETARRLRAEREALQRLAEHQDDESRTRTGGWEAAISAALDDAELTVALRALTQPVAAIGRRSAPLALSQLVSWAADCHRADPQAPLGDVLAEVLNGDAVAPNHPTTRGIPEPPSPAHDCAPLRERVLRLLPAIDNDLPNPTPQEEDR